MPRRRCSSAARPASCDVGDHAWSPGSVIPSALAAHVTVTAARDAVGEPQHEVIVVVAGARRHDRRTCAPARRCRARGSTRTAARRCERCVGRPRDTCRLRTRSIEPPATPTTRTSIGAQRGGVRCNGHVRHQRPAVADGCDVRRRSADLDDHAVGDRSAKRKGTGNRRGRAGVQRAWPALAKARRGRWRRRRHASP